jgi:hypothetical protein
MHDINPSPPRTTWPIQIERRRPRNREDIEEQFEDESFEPGTSSTTLAHHLPATRPIPTVLLLLIKARDTPPKDPIPKFLLNTGSSVRC